MSEYSVYPKWKKIYSALTRSAGRLSVVEFSHDWTSGKPVQVLVLEDERGLFLKDAMVMGDSGMFEPVGKDWSLYGRLERLVSTAKTVDELVEKLGASFVAPYEG